MPRGETDKDLQNEAEILRFVIAKYATRYDDFVKLSHLGYRLDHGLTKRHPFGYLELKVLCEVKQRTYAFRHFPEGYMISASKLEAADELTRAFGLKCFLFVRFSDGIIASRSFARPCTTFREGGRDDRRNFKNDREKVAIFPWSDFTVLNPRSEAA